MTPKEISERFDISIPAAKIRMEELERMKRRRLGIKRPLPQGVREFLEDAKRRGYTVKSLD